MADYINEKQQTAKLSELFDLVDKTNEQINTWSQVTTTQEASVKFEQVGLQLREMQRILKWLAKQQLK